MGKPVFYIVLFITLFAFPFGFAQTNLVYNGGFEEYYSCPQANDLNDGQLELCKGWWKPTMGTSDYFNRCNPFIVSVPRNFWGYQEAFQGDGYVGLVPMEWMTTTGDQVSNEYVQTQLIQPLIPCVEYHFEMQVNLANYSLYGHKRLGALFTRNSIHTSSHAPLELSPQILNSSNFLTDTVNWVTISGNFIAEGGEQYLCIGYFFDSIQNDTSYIQEPPVLIDSRAAYYYIDNVSLIEIGKADNCDYEIPNIITPNNDGINDLWYYIPSTEGHIEIINRWGNKVYEATGYSFTWNGENCPDGVYYFVYTTEKETKAGYIQLIR